MATKEQLKTWIVDNQDKQGKEGKDGQDFEKVKSKYLSLRGKTSRAEADAKTGDYSVGAERARTVAQGVTLGFADEIEAGARSLFSDSKYKDIRDEIRQNTSDFRTDNPGQALALEMAGGVVIPGGILRSGAKLALNAGKGIPSKVLNKAVSLKPKPSDLKYNSTEQLNRVTNSANTYKKAIGNNAALGATYGAGASESESASGIAADAALGGAVGGVAGGAILGATRQLRPLVSGDSRVLAAKAVDRAKGGYNPLYITRGQASTSPVERAAEGQYSNVSKTIKQGRAEGLEGYNMQVFDDVFELANRGSKKAGYKEGLALAENNADRARVIRDMVSDNYDTAYRSMRFNVKDKALDRDLSKWYQQAIKGKSDDVVKEINKQYASITAIMATIPNKAGTQSSDSIKKLFSSVRRKHENVLKKSNTGDDIASDLKEGEFGSVYQSLENSIKKNISKNSKGAIDDYNATQYAYNAVLSLEDAVSKSVGKGLFTPTQVSNAFSRKGRNANATRTNKALSKGIGDIAYNARTKYKDVVGDTIPDSGTSGSIISTGSLLGLGGLVGSGAVLNPAILGMIGIVGAKALQYHPSMVKSFNTMIAKGNYRKAADMLERYAATSGAAGVEVNQLINELRQGR